MTDVPVTEFIEIDPDELHLVGKGANGFKALLAKSADEEVRAALEEFADAIDMTIVDKADGDATSDPDDDRPACKTCGGNGKIMEGHRTCPTCKGSGKQPKVGDSAKATAPSGSPTPPAKDCPTCNGSGMIAGDGADGKECPDCNGTGVDGQMPPVDKLNAQPGFVGSMDNGNGRTTIDKADMSSADINDLPDSAFAHIESGGKKDPSGKTVPRSLRHFPVHDEAHARNALARAGQSPFGDKAMPKIKAAAKKFGIDVAEDSKKGAIEKDSGTVVGANPFLGATVSTATPADDPAGMPGSPEWEASDAECATSAAQYLMQASELISHFADRETIEMAAGEGNDLFDSYDAECALDMVTAALGVIARLAFHESMEANKGVATKAGKRLSTKSVTALAAARDHLSSLLGDDDPAKSDDDDDAAKASDDQEVISIMDITAEELGSKVASAVAQGIAEAAKGFPPKNEADSVSNAKNVNNKSKKKNPKDDNTDLEDEADQGDGDSASGTGNAPAAAKAELTPEQVEARKAKQDAKETLRKARKAEKKAAKDAAVAKAATEGMAEAVKAVQTLQERLAEVEKRAAPGGPAKTRSPEVAQKAAERDTIDLEIARYDRLAKESTEQELAREYRARAASARKKLAELNA